MTEIESKNNNLTYDGMPFIETYKLKKAQTWKYIILLGQCYIFTREDLVCVWSLTNQIKYFSVSINPYIIQGHWSTSLILSLNLGGQRNKKKKKNSCIIHRQP